jgi:hypothetical protein
MLLCHRLLGDARLWELLARIDGDLAAAARAGGCPICGGALHLSRYPRKPRGGPEDLAGYERRESFCCAEEGCRKRLTPPSLRFLGRKVYLGAVVVLLSALRHGATGARLARLGELTGASRRTLDRRREWWREAFAASPFWKAAAGHFDRPVERELLPLSLLARFAGDELERLVAALRFLSPLSTASSRDAMAF